MELTEGKNERQKAAHRSGCAGLFVVCCGLILLIFMAQKMEYLPPDEADERYLSIQKFCADAGYRGAFISDLEEQIDLDVDISEKIKPHQWEILPWRWVVERNLSWLNHSRRLSKDYNISVSSAEAMVKISHFHTLIKRL